MKQKTKSNGKGQRVAPILVILAVVCWALAIGLGLRSYQAWQTVSAMDVNLPADANEVFLKQALEADKKVAEALKKKNLIAPPPPEQNPVREVTGILGHEALINGKWCKVGDKIGEAEILAIEPTFVKVTWKGQEKTLAPMGSAGGGGGGPGPSPRGPMGPRGERPPRPSRSGGGRVIMGGPPPGLPDGMTPEKIKSMSPEERRAFFEEMRGRR